MTLLPRTFEISQMPGTMFFGVSKRIKKHLSRGSSVRVMKDHAMPKFKAREAAGTGSTVPTSFSSARFI
jgi:hypothetical protein